MTVWTKLGCQINRWDVVNQSDEIIPNYQLNVHMMNNQIKVPQIIRWLFSFQITVYQSSDELCKTSATWSSPQELYTENYLHLLALYNSLECAPYSLPIAGCIQLFLKTYYYREKPACPGVPQHHIFWFWIGNYFFQNQAGVEIVLNSHFILSFTWVISIGEELFYFINL